MISFYTIFIVFSKKYLPLSLISLIIYLIGWGTATGYSWYAHLINRQFYIRYVAATYQRQRHAKNNENHSPLPVSLS